MNEQEIYYYKNMMGGNPRFKFGGVADKLKAKMLYELGGTHIDLDVTFLRPFNYSQEYVFRPHPRGVVGNVIKAPKNSELARLYYEWTTTINEDNQDWEASFKGLVNYVYQLKLQQFIVPKDELGNDTFEYWWDFMKTSRRPEHKLKLIHWCNAMGETYIENSYYNELLHKYKLK